MNNWQQNERARPLVAAFNTIVVIIAFLLEEMQLTKTVRYAKPSMFQDLTWKRHMHRILRSSQDYYTRYLRMAIGPFMHLSSIMRISHLLVDTKYVTVEEQLPLFLHIVSYNTKNRIIHIEFLCFGETIIRYFIKHYELYAWSLIILFIPQVVFVTLRLRITPIGILVSR